MKLLIPILFGYFIYLIINEKKRKNTFVSV